MEKTDTSPHFVFLKRPSKGNGDSGESLPRTPIRGENPPAIAPPKNVNCITTNHVHLGTQLAFRPHSRIIAFGSTISIYQVVSPKQVSTICRMTL